MYAVAVSDELVGYANLLSKNNQGISVGLEIYSAYQNHGFGTQCMGWILEAAKEHRAILRRCPEFVRTITASLKKL